MNAFRSIALPLLASICSAALSPGQSTQQTDATASKTVYKTTARTVVVDIVVTDSSGQPVTGLTREQFQVKEDGTPQTIVSFEPHIGTHPQPLKPPPPLPPGEYTNYPIAPPTDSVNVLLLDALNTPLPDQAQVRQAVTKYLKNVTPGTRIAIFTLTSQLNFVQGFTADPALLRAAVDGAKRNSSPQPSALLDTQADLAQQQETINLLSASMTAASVASMQSFLAGQQTYDRARVDGRIALTLEALNQIARYLAGIPGRKNLIWFSGSFPLNIIPDSSGNAIQGTLSYSDDIHETTDLLSLGQVAVYPVGAAGMRVSSVFSDSSVSGNYYGHTPATLLKENSGFTSREASDQAAMNDMAWQTGGRAIYNTNDLVAALARDINDGSNYYTLSYSPTNKALDGKLRSIEIKIGDKKYKLSYRRSYFADDADGRKRAVDPAGDNPFRAAMSPGLPPASQILFKAKAELLDPQPANLNASYDPKLKARNTPPDSQTSPGETLGDNHKLKRPVVRYEIDYAANIRDLHFTMTPDGVRHGSMIVSIVVYNDGGAVQNSLTKTAELNLSSEAYTAMLKSGMHLHAEIDVPKGPLHLRTGIYDVASSKMGILEMPLIGVATAEKK